MRPDSPSGGADSAPPTSILDADPSPRTLLLRTRIFAMTFSLALTNAKVSFRHFDTVASWSANLCRQKWNADVDIEDLQTFVEVADAGGVSPAARRLGVSKSIVSRRLFRLEAELGVQLLARTTRGAALTEAGRHVPRARRAGLRRDRCCARDDPARRRLARPPADCSAAVLRPDAFGTGVRGAGAATSAAACARQLQRSFRRHCRRRFRLRSARRLSRRFKPDRASHRADPWKARRKPGLYQGAWGARDTGRTPHAPGAYARDGNLAVHRRRQDDLCSSAGSVQGG